MPNKTQGEKIDELTNIVISMRAELTIVHAELNELKRTQLDRLRDEVGELKRDRDERRRLFLTVLSLLTSLTAVGISATTAAMNYFMPR
jgi:hypothetical protein